ncbi:MAG: PilZ domain-containing protein [Alphaproteobacteria bacterium]|nr:PilZ domain-containing protein [Alphaproteobacteria bacterium]
MAKAQAKKSTADTDRRTGARVEIDGHTTVTLAVAGRVFDALIEDISLKGAKLKIDGNPALEDSAILEHPKAGQLTGRCKRSRGGTVAMEFDVPESPLERALQCIAITLFADEEHQPG